MTAYRMRPPLEPGDYVELVDENDPRGPVRYCHADGTPFAWMTRNAYEALCAAQPTEREEKP